MEKMYYSMKMNKTTKEKVEYAFGPTMEELDGVIEIDRATGEPSIVKNSAKVPMRISTLGKLIVQILKGEVPEKYYFAS